MGPETILFRLLRFAGVVSLLALVSEWLGVSAFLFDCLLCFVRSAVWIPVFLRWDCKNAVG